MTSSTCQITWLLHESHHSCLKGFQIQIKTADGRIFKDVAVPKTLKLFNVRQMQQCQDYTVSVSALCMADENSQRTESECSTVNLTTIPEKVKNLKLENSTPNSLSINWDTPLVGQNLRYKLSIEGSPQFQEDESDGLQGRP